MSRSLLIPDVDFHIIKVYINSGIIIFRGFESAHRAVSLAYMIVPAVFILKHVMTSWAYLHIIYKVYAPLYVPRHLFYPEIYTAVFRCHSR